MKFGGGAGLFPYRPDRSITVYSRSKHAGNVSIDNPDQNAARHPTRQGGRRVSRLQELLDCLPVLREQDQRHSEQHLQPDLVRNTRTSGEVPGESVLTDVPLWNDADAIELKVTF